MAFNQLLFVVFAELYTSGMKLSGFRLMLNMDVFLTVFSVFVRHRQTSACGLGGSKV